MRALGFLLILVGIAIGIIWPWVQVKFQGSELAELRGS